MSKTPSWTEGRVRKLAGFFPPKFKDRILEALAQQGVSAAVKIIKLAQKAMQKEDSVVVPPHPSTSRAKKPQLKVRLTPLQQKVYDGLKLGYSVGKIARLNDLNLHSVKKAKSALHRKKLIVVSCTPPKGTIGTIKSSPQVHNFTVAVIVPFVKGTNWRVRLNKSKVRNYKKVFLKYNFQEYFSLSAQVSVRATSSKLILTVKDIYDVSPAAAKAQAWELAVSAAHQLQAVYNFAFGDEIKMRFRGAEWALVNHEVARLCSEQGIKPVTFIQGKKRMWVDDTPAKSLEFSRQSDAERSYNDEESRVFRGLTNEFLAEQLLRFEQVVEQRFQDILGAQLTTNKQLSVLIKVLTPPKIEPVDLGRPDYFG